MRVFGFGLLLLSVLAFNAYATPFFGPAWNFSVLGATTVTNTGATTLNADLGVCCGGTAVTGSGTITFTGAPPNNVIASTPNAAAGQLEATNAVSAINTLGPGLSVGPDLTGQVLADSGGLNTVYDVGATTFNIASGGVLTLNFNGHSGENIIFVMSSSLITGSGSSVLIENAGSNDNVFWEVGSSATLGTTTSFVGNIIASTAVTLDTGATIGCGSVVAQTAAVTMDHNTISDTCTMSSTSTPAPVTPTPTGPGTTVTVLEGGSTLLYLGFLLIPIGAMRAFRRRSV
jgi:hypothetical protein